LSAKMPFACVNRFVYFRPDRMRRWLPASTIAGGGRWH